MAAFDLAVRRAKSDCLSLVSSGIEPLQHFEPGSYGTHATKGHVPQEEVPLFNAIETSKCGLKVLYSIEIVSAT